MNTRQLLSIVVCAGLAACGGISAENARWYDPQLVRQNGPVAITVVGAQGVDQSAIAATIANSLRAHGAQAGTLTPVGAFDPGYRVAVVLGPVAYDLTASGGADNYASTCRTINSQAGASLSAPGAASVAGDGTPVLAIMCYRNDYEALAYAKLSGGNSVQAKLPAMVAQLFPPEGAND